MREQFDPGRVKHVFQINLGRRFHDDAGAGEEVGYMCRPDEVRTGRPHYGCRMRVGGALVAGHGIGGMAIALAVQNVLADVLAYVSIVADQPFADGDYLVVGDFSGTVEHIGIKTTRVRSLSGELIIFSNNDLLGSRVRNYRKMNERRAVFAIGVTYGTPHDVLKSIPDKFKAAIEAQEHTRFDRAHLKDFGDFSINFEIVYYMLEPAYATYMDTQQAINLAVYDDFTRSGIEFAFPTQTLFLQRSGSN